MNQELLQKQILPDGWKVVELQGVADFLRGPFGSSVQKSLCVKKGQNTYKLYEQGNVINNDFERGVYYLTEERFLELRKFEVRPGDILMTCAGTLGRTAIVPDGIEKGIINSVLMRIRLDKSRVNNRYFLYNLKSPQFQYGIISKSFGAALKNLFATKQLKKFKIVLPPISLQEQIVDRLDKRMAQIGRIKEEMEARKAAISLGLSSFIDDEITKLNCSEVEFGDLASEFRYGTSKKGTSNTSGTPILRIPNILGGEIDLDFDNLVYTSLESLEKRKLLLRKGDMLFVRTNGNPKNIGRCAVFVYENDKYAFASYLIRARIKMDKAIPQFLDILFKEGQGRKQLLERATTSAGNYNINIASLRSIKLKVPSLEEQEKIIRRYKLYKNEISLLRLNHDVQLEAICQLPSSIINEALRRYQSRELMENG